MNRIQLAYVYAFLLCLLLLQSRKAEAQFDKPSPLRLIKFQISAMAVISSYYNDNRITANTHSGQGLGASVKAEIPLVKGIKFLPGIEILTQGLSFDSYYFATGYSQIYDGNYNYNHSIRTTEIGLPLLFKVNMKLKEEVMKNNFYFTVGWEPKYNLNAHTTITKNDDGSLLYDKKIDLPYENYFFGTADIGNYVVGGLGYNHNFLPHKYSIVFDLTYRYGLSRYVYSGNNGTNDVLFKNTNFSFSIGLRF
jgi:hypothetical protein